MFPEWSKNMSKLEEQIRELSPSVKDALYRRLLFAKDLAWLRDDDKKDAVIGFEVAMNEQELSGFALIAIQRHTVIAFVSDRDEEPKLILFPALEILFDPGFELLDLTVTRKIFTDSTFVGESTGHGRFGDMVKDLTPPERKVDISNTVLNQMSNVIKNAEEPEPKQEIVNEPQPQTEGPEEFMEDRSPNEFTEDGPPDGFVEDDTENFDSYTEPTYNGYDDYDDYDDYDEPEPEPQPSSDQPGNRSEWIKSQKFSALHEVSDFAVANLGVDRALAVTLVNRAMQSKVSPEYRIELAVTIFCKLIDEGKI